MSYVKWHFWPYPQEDDLEEWVTNRFGKQLYEIFFKTYTEKVWGIPCAEISADWAAQRINGLSVASLQICTTQNKSRAGAGVQDRTDVKAKPLSLTH